MLYIDQVSSTVESSERSPHLEITLNTFHPIVDWKMSGAQRRKLFTRFVIHHVLFGTMKHNSIFFQVCRIEITERWLVSVEEEEFSRFLLREKTMNTIDKLCFESTQLWAKFRCHEWFLEKNEWKKVCRFAIWSYLGIASVLRKIFITTNNLMSSGLVRDSLGPVKWHQRKTSALSSWGWLTTRTVFTHNANAKRVSVFKGKTADPYSGGFKIRKNPVFPLRISSLVLLVRKLAFAMQHYFHAYPVTPCFSTESPLAVMNKDDSFRVIDDTQNFFPPFDIQWFKH